MRQFYPTSLYVKTHNITGLKYFGKTTKDPFTYKGSGIYWRSHLKVHGNSVTTEVIGYYTDKEECRLAALEFSTAHNIVHEVNEHNKKIWANQIIETGLDGGNTGRTVYGPHTEEAKRKMSVARKGSVPWNKGLKGVNPGNCAPRSNETRLKLSAANLGKRQSGVTIEKRRQTLLAQHRKLTDEHKEIISKSHLGKKLSSAHIQKMRDRIVSDETKEKIRHARARQIITEDTKQKLKGKVVVIDKMGVMAKITKEQYLAQLGPKDKWQWVAHRSIEARARKR